MIAQNRIWVMTKIKYVVYKRVDPGESYHLGTYPRPKKGILFYRDYYLWDKNGDVVAAATSQWCILNFKTRRPERTDIEVPGECIDHEPFDAGIEKIRWMPEEGDDPQMLYHVTEDDLDKNQHVNNARYAVMIDILRRKPCWVMRSCFIRMLKKLIRKLQTMLTVEPASMWSGNFRTAPSCLRAW